MVNTFVIVNITPIWRDSLKDKPMLFHSKKAFSLTSLEQSFERKAYWFVLKANGAFLIRTQADETEDGEHFANS